MASSKQKIKLLQLLIIVLLINYGCKEEKKGFGGMYFDQTEFNFYDFQPPILTVYNFEDSIIKKYRYKTIDSNLVFQEISGKIGLKKTKDGVKFFDDDTKIFNSFENELIKINRPQIKVNKNYFFGVYWGKDSPDGKFIGLISVPKKYKATLYSYFPFEKNKYEFQQTSKYDFKSDLMFDKFIIMQSGIFLGPVLIEKLTKDSLAIRDLKQNRVFYLKKYDDPIFVCRCKK